MNKRIKLSPIELIHAAVEEDVKEGTLTETTLTLRRGTVLSLSNLATECTFVIVLRNESLSISVSEKEPESRRARRAEYMNKEHVTPVIPHASFAELLNPDHIARYIRISKEIAKCVSIKTVPECFRVGLDVCLKVTCCNDKLWSTEYRELVRALMGDIEECFVFVKKDSLVLSIKITN